MKIINSQCRCKKYLLDIPDLIVLFPCEHIFHSTCIKNEAKCPLCNSTIVSILHEYELKKNWQIYKDVLSMKKFGESEISYGTIYNKSINILDCLKDIFMAKDPNNALYVCKNIFNLFNISLYINNQHNILKHSKVIIANHTNYFDPAILYYIFRCGFLSSSIVRKSSIGKKIAEIMPLLIIDRKKSTNTVNKIKKFIKENGDMALFPEGMIKNPNTLARFRSGAFHVGYPVQPIIIKYDPPIHDTSITNYLLKMLSCKKMSIFVNILKPVYPPFNNEKIEQVRYNMSIEGNLALTRTSNRDILD